MKALCLFSAALFGIAAATLTPEASTTTKKSPCKATKAATTTTTTSTSATTKTTLASACNADNCARAVTGTANGLATQSAHKSDCSSFLRCTAYPPTSTVTVTATAITATQTATIFPVTYTQKNPVTTETTAVATLTDVETAIATSVLDVTIPVIETVLTTVIEAKRFITTHALTTTEALSTTQAPSASVMCPTAVPTYASACSGTARFSSACSCFRVSKTTTTATTPTTTVTVTMDRQTTVTVSDTQTVTSPFTVVIPVTDLTTVITTAIVVETETSIATLTDVVVVDVPAPTGNAYCSDGTPVDGTSPSCTSVGCSTTNLRIEGASDTIYEGTILSGPSNITTPSGGTHLCDGTNNGANPAPFANGIGTIDAAGQLCGFGFDGTFSQQFDDFFIEDIGDTSQTGEEYWGILLNYQFTPAGGCETEVHATDELLWAFNAFNVNYFLRVEPTQTPVVLAPGQSTTFTVQGTDGNGDPFVNIAGASLNGQLSDSNGQVTYTAPSTPGTYRYKATRADSIRSNAVTIQVQG